MFAHRGLYYIKFLTYINLLIYYITITIKLTICFIILLFHHEAEKKTKLSINTSLASSGGKIPYLVDLGENKLSNSTNLRDWRDRRDRG